MYGAVGAHRSTVDRTAMTKHPPIETKLIKGQPDFVRAALFGLCPRCSANTMFASVTQFSGKCANCHLDYQQFNVGDGPAALMIIPIGAVIITLAILLDVAVRPPFWLHVIIWVPVTIAMVVGFLRFAKAAMLTLEYRNRAGEGRTAAPASDQAGEDRDGGPS
jgi:uncharacterized protein (DUF983 family)